MPDYGHPIRFRSFITPVNSPASAPVRLAVLSEELGFDLVTFQDHPYQPAFLDTWTLLSWVAARTERIHLSGNVLNVPLRTPSGLAGAGAGGAPPPPPGGGGAPAVEEAIDVIRGRWDTADRGVLRTGGAFHHVDGA